jgi:endonuclease/exonuclease/phosphatase family metal-dependent hydrolase
MSLPAVLALVVGGAPAEAGSAGTDRELRVLVFNIHAGIGTDGELDLQRVGRVIRSSRADVVGLQEVDRHFSARSDWADQGRKLARELDMHLVYGANIDEEPPAPGRPRVQYGNAILSRYPIVSSGNTLLYRSEGEEQRGLLRAVVDLPGADLEVFNTHLSATSAADRAQQTTQIRQLIGTPGQRPVVLVGDLNATPEAPEIATLNGFLSDSWTVAGEGRGYTYDSEDPVKRIDYIYTSEGLQLLHSRVVDTHRVASDHLPVAVELRRTSQRSGG